MLVHVIYATLAPHLLDTPPTEPPGQIKTDAGNRRIMGVPYYFYSKAEQLCFDRAHVFLGAYLLDARISLIVLNAKSIVMLPFSMPINKPVDSSCDIFPFFIRS